MKSLLKKIPKMVQAIIFALLFLAYFNIPIYPDEQAYWIQLYRGFRDGGTINNFVPMCESFWETHVPTSWYLGRWWLGLLNGQIERPVSFRLMGLLYFVALLLMYKLLLKEVYEGAIKSKRYVLLLFLGFIPVSLVYVRPESQFLIYLFIAIYVYILSAKHDVKYIYTIWVFPLMFSILINLHGRAIFLLPLFAYMLLTVGVCENGASWWRLLPLTILAWIGFESYSTYSALYSCPEDLGVVEILNSLRFDPALLKAEWGVIFKDLINRHVDALAILKGAVFFNPGGAFPLPHKNFPITASVIFAGIKLLLLAALLFAAYNLSVILNNFIKLRSVNNKHGKFGLIFFLMMFLYFDVILMKPDRFYESSLFWPILLLVIVMQLDLLSVARPNFSGFAIRAVGRIIVVAFYLMAIVFLVVYGRDLISKSWAGPYVSVRKHNVDLYRSAINKAASDAGINIKTAHLVLADFHTINYTAAGNYPVMANLFWWFSDKSTSGYVDSFGRLKLLHDLGGDAVIMRCDSLPPAIQSLANQFVIDRNESDDSINKICGISRSQMGKINYKNYLVNK